MKNIFLILIAIFGWNFFQAQCMAVDFSVSRLCIDGQGQISIFTADPDSVIYSIDGGATFTNDPVFFNLNNGSYNVIVQDTTGCQITSTVVIEPFLQMSTINITTSCADPNGEIIASATNGKPIYSYSFDGGVTFIPDSNIAGIGAGSYDIVIEDSYGCQVDSTVTVPSFPTISPDIVTTNELCNGSGPGMVDITFTAGGTYDFSLNNGATTSGTTFNNATILAGFHVIEITDVNGCTAPFQFQIGQDLVDDSVSIVHDNCHASVGSVTVSGFLGISPYSYSNDNGATYGASGLFANLAQGEHIIFIKDDVGCIKEDTIYVSNFGDISATASNEDTICNGNSAIVSVLHNGGPNVNYSWNNSLGNAQTHTVSPFTTTTYSVIVTDPFGCKDTVETTIYVEITPNLMINNNQIQACVGEDITITASGATNYQWSTGVNDTLATLTYTAVGNETISVTGSNGQCSSSVQTVIIIKPSPTVDIFCNVTSINTGDSIFFNSSNTVTSTRQWDFGDGYYSQQTNPYHRFDTPGGYNVTLTAEMGDCQASESILVWVGTVAIEDVNSNFNVQLFPNPAKDVLHINIPQESLVRIYNSVGALVLTKKLTEGNNTVVVDLLSKGYYIVELSNADNIYKHARIIIE